MPNLFEESVGKFNGSPGFFSQPYRLELGREAEGVYACAVHSRISSTASCIGYGSGRNYHEAALKATAESLERYCAYLPKEKYCLLEPATSLGDSALNLDTLPVCSEMELKASGCPVRSPSKSKPIRWVKGVSLTTGLQKLVPAILAYTHIQDVMPAEKFCRTVSTGCSAHYSYQEALIRGIYEVVERDIVATAWLQKLTLRPISQRAVDEALVDLLPKQTRLQFTFLDATTSIGLPTVYGMREDPSSSRVHTLVSCSTCASQREAIQKAYVDLLCLEPAFRREHTIPRVLSEFTDLLDGATYMARAERREQFTFLKKGSRLLPEPRSLVAKPDDLGEVLERLSSCGHEVFAVDLTRPDVRSLGLFVVRIVIPSLQPLSFSYSARFLGHQRMWTLPNELGITPLTGADINGDPQPFA